MCAALNIRESGQDNGLSKKTSAESFFSQKTLVLEAGRAGFCIAAASSFSAIFIQIKMNDRI